MGARFYATEDGHSTYLSWQAPRWEGKYDRIQVLGHEVATAVERAVERAAKAVVREAVTTYTGYKAGAELQKRGVPNAALWGTFTGAVAGSALFGSD